MTVKSDALKTADIIEYLQEHDLWDDPEGDMDPKELWDFCQSLMLTQEVDFVDIHEWVALKKAHDITEESAEIIKDIPTSHPKLTLSDLGSVTTHPTLTRQINTTVTRVVDDISGSLYHSPVESLKIFFPMHVGPKTMGMLVKMLIDHFGTKVEYAVVPNRENSSTCIWVNNLYDKSSFNGMEMTVNIDLE